LEILAKNINLNNQTDKISIIPVAISDKSGFGKLNMSNTEWGGALSTFNKPYGYDGNILNKIFEYSLLAMSMDDASGKFKIPSPDYIKIDVDGIEHLILLGGSEVLTDVKSLLIEVSIKFKEQKNNSQEYLKKAGLTLVRGFINGTTEDTVNQIWIRR
jgi:FkbM family methyltransferase